MFKHLNKLKLTYTFQNQVQKARIDPPNTRNAQNKVVELGNSPWASHVKLVLPTVILMMF